MVKLLILFFCVFPAFSVVGAVESSDSSAVFIKKINYFSNKEGKEHYYSHFVKLKLGEKYDTTSVIHSVRRLEELDQFSRIKLVEYFEGDSVTLNYYLNESKKIKVKPHGDFIAKPDTVINQAYASLTFTLKNLFRRNSSFFLKVSHSLPVGYSNIPIIVRKYKYQQLSLGFFNEYLTKLFFTTSLYGNYSFTSSSVIHNVDEQFYSLNANMGKRFGYNKIDFQYAFFDRQSFIHNQENRPLSHNRYPRLTANWFFDNKSSEHYYAKRTTFNAGIMKYGLGEIDTLEVDFGRFYANSKFVSSLGDFKFMTNLYVTQLFMIEKISVDQYLYAGGLQTNRGYLKNSLPNPYGDKVGSDSYGAKYYDGFQVEARYHLTRLGPFQNFFGNHFSSFWDAALWVDYTRVKMMDKEEDNYYSYGTGIRAYNNKIHAYISVDASLNKEEKFLISVTNGLHF